MCVLAFQKNLPFVLFRLTDFELRGKVQIAKPSATAGLLPKRSATRLLLRQLLLVNQRNLANADFSIGPAFERRRVFAEQFTTPPQALHAFRF